MLVQVFCGRIVSVKLSCKGGLMKIEDCIIRDKSRYWSFPDEGLALH